MKQLLQEINQAKYLFGYRRGIVISEQEIKDKIFYQRCEGGYGLIDPESYIILDIKSEDNKPVMKFEKLPRTGKEFNNGESDSIGSCLGLDIPIVGRCWSIGQSEGYTIAWMEVDCETGKEK